MKPATPSFPLVFAVQRTECSVSTFQPEWAALMSVQIMLHEVEPQAFRRLLSLMPASGCSMEPVAVLLGNNPGRAFVDDLQNARCSLIWSRGMEGFYLAGQPGTRGFWLDAQRVCLRVLDDQYGAHTCSSAEVSGVGEGWDQAIEDAYAGQRLEAWKQLVFIDAEGSLPPEDSVGQAGHEVRPIDESLLADATADPHELVRRSIGRFWASPSAFTSIGLGAAVLADGHVVSICHSGFVAGRTHVLNAETVAEYRGQGLGYAGARAMLRLCREHTVTPYWDCTADNTASGMLAQKLRMRFAREYTCYAIPLV